jgi:His-Xaa-Ser system protein HxsD
VWPGLGTDTLGEYAHVLIDRAIYGDTAIFKTAYWFTDRFYVFLDNTPDNRLAVELRPKVSSPSTDLQTACAEFCNSLVDFRVRTMVLNETKGVREALVTKAFMEGIPKPRADGDQSPSDTS